MMDEVAHHHGPQQLAFRGLDEHLAPRAKGPGPLESGQIRARKRRAEADDVRVEKADQLLAAPELRPGLQGADVQLLGFDNHPAAIGNGGYVGGERAQRARFLVWAPRALAEREPLEETARG
jgi:hypothetical protein